MQAKELEMINEDDVFVEDVRVVPRPWQREPAASAVEPANRRRVTEEPSGLSPAQTMARMVLDDSAADARAAVRSANSAIELFCVRRDVPERYKQILVGLTNLVADIETERTVFERSVKKAEG
jgi:hypothetical protein